MNVASGRMALILVTGLFVALGGALQATEAAPASAKQDGASKSTDAVRTTKHRRHYARTRTNKTAQKSADDKAAKGDIKSDIKTDNKDMAVSEATPASSAMPASVANANAQLAAADTPLAAAATAMTAQANENVQAATAGQPAASDQLSEADRALPPDNQQKTVVAAVDAQPRPAPVMASATSDSSTWDQTSLIGKIFIGFGALLTLASAARMFMA
ncbi:hypothetical protein C2U70_04455 [Bradyrhizobium guangdongense]|uniref:hypothetical protein n=1 Tax=Bradyrhizobium guangdongense TaxID=1325090 RepID=UPI00112BD4FA|nr:hypothetical protein [Bradyrhizobium guangdongense]TPQ40751.1 hypothetical protein C2U70_04455 [Bradyrhizobium guangdongense]